MSKQMIKIEMTCSCQEGRPVPAKMVVAHSWDFKDGSIDFMCCHCGQEYTLKPIQRGRE